MPTGGEEWKRLKFLLDTNFVIAVEPYSGELEVNAEVAASFVRVANEQGHLLCVAPATRDDLLEGQDKRRRHQRLTELEKFHPLTEVPISADLRRRAGDSEPGSNDERDLRILAALDAGAVAYLVTDDSRLRRRAVRAGLGESVLAARDGLDLLLGFEPTQLAPPPRVTPLPTYAINRDDHIFEGLREDYDGFDGWLVKVMQESDSRRCLVIQQDDEYAAISLLKPEPGKDIGLTGSVLKVSTFKVSPRHGGVRFGELLLKAILLRTERDVFTALYVEVLPSHPEMLDFLASFGFSDSQRRTTRGEHVMVKQLVPDETSTELSDLDFHIRYGPPALLCRQRIFVVPIEPQWHDQLFPEQAPQQQSTQLTLFGAAEEAIHPWGNALRKAYLCGSPTNQIQSGDCLLFYRSGYQSVSAVGIVEGVQRTAEVDELIRFVGGRTVYSVDEIGDMARRARGVLAIRFRQDRFLEPPLTLTDLQLAGVLKSWPQSITQLKGSARTWTRDQLIG